MLGPEDDGLRVVGLSVRRRWPHRPDPVEALRLPAVSRKTVSDATLRAVALAYRRERMSGHGDLEAYQAAMQAYRKRRPEEPENTAQHEVGRLIAEAAERAPWDFGVHLAEGA